MSECNLACFLKISAIAAIPVLIVTIGFQWLFKKLVKTDVRFASMLVTYAWLYVSAVVGLLIALYGVSFYMKKTEEPFWLNKPTESGKKAAQKLSEMFVDSSDSSQKSKKSKKSSTKTKK